MSLALVARTRSEVVAREKREVGGAISGAYSFCGGTSLCLSFGFLAAEQARSADHCRNGRTGCAPHWQDWRKPLGRVGGLAIHDHGGGQFSGFGIGALRLPFDENEGDAAAGGLILSDPLISIFANAVFTSNRLNLGPSLQAVSKDETRALSFEAHLVTARNANQSQQALAPTILYRPALNSRKMIRKQFIFTEHEA